jgi:hypothetical protein
VEGLRRVARVRRQAARYVRAIVWVVRFVIRSFGWSALRPLISGPIGLALIGTGLGLGIAIVGTFETGAVVSIAGYELSAVDSTTLPWLATTVAALVAVGGLGVYHAHRGAIQIAARSKVALVEEVLSVRGGVLPTAADYVDDKRVNRAVQRLLTSDPQRVALALRRLLESPVSLAVALGATIAMFLLEPVAAGAVLVFMLLATPFYYNVNRRAVAATKRLEDVAPVARSSARDLVRSLGPQARITRAAVRHRVGAYSALGDAAEAWSQRLLAVARADLTSQGLTAVAFLGLIAYLGSNIFGGTTSFTMAVAFVALMRIALGGVRTLLRAFASFSRYYPAVYRLHLYTSPGHSDTNWPASASLAFRIHAEGTSETGQRRFSVSTTGALGITPPFTPSRFTAGFFARLLERQPKDRGRVTTRPSVAVVRARQPPTEGTTLRTLLELEQSLTLDTLGLSADDRAELVRSGCRDLDAVVTRDTWKSLPDGVRARLTAAVGLLDRPHVVVIELATLRHVVRSQPPEGSAPALFLGWSRSAPSGDSTAAHLVVAADGSVVAAGSPAFVRSQWPGIAVARELVHADLSVRGTAADEDDEDDA